MQYRHYVHSISVSNLKHSLSRLHIAIAASMILLVAPFAHAQTTATMVSPADGSTVSGTITISASISGPYASVVFWRDSWTQIGQSSSPQLSYNTASLSAGSHQFFVSVLDSAGNTLCASNIVTVTVSTTTTATMVSPANGSTVSGTITISASISGSYGSVVFWRDNWVQIGQNSSPQLSYDTSSLSGSHQFFVSVLDSAGNTLCASNIVTVTVQSGGSEPPQPDTNLQFLNVDDPGNNWLIGDGGGDTSGSYFSQGNSLAGRNNVADFYVTGTGGSGRYEYHCDNGNCSSGLSAVAQNVVYEFDLYVPGQYAGNGSINAIEMEVQQSDNSANVYNMAWQFRYISGGMMDLRIFDYYYAHTSGCSNDSLCWPSSGIQIAQFAGDTWYHVRAHYSISGSTITHDWIEVEPVGSQFSRHTPTQNNVHQSYNQSGYGPSFNNALQLDLTYPNPIPYHVYFDAVDYGYNQSNF